MTTHQRLKGAIMKYIANTHLSSDLLKALQTQIDEHEAWEYVQLWMTGGESNSFAFELQHMLGTEYIVCQDWNKADQVIDWLGRQFNSIMAINYA